MSHLSAPVAVRERLALPVEAVPDLLRGLIDGGPIGEALVVSTCNRVDVVAAGSNGARSNLADVAGAIRQAIARRAPGVTASLYEHLGRDAVRHLFRVTASLDSLVVGESQILGQVKSAYDLAREAGTTGAVLNRVIPRAVRSAKRVRSETTIGAGHVSIPSVAVELAGQIFGDLSRHTVALVGSGEMGESVARLLRQAGARLLVIGRNGERVRAIAGALGGEPRSLSDLDLALVEADIVVTTTSAPGFIVGAEQVGKLRRARRGRNLFFIDLAVPRDVDPRVGELDSVFLYNVDDLSRVVGAALESRRREADRAEVIVVEEAESYERWVDGEQATPTLVELRRRFRDLADVELKRSLDGKLRHLVPADREAMRVMMDAALNKMLHPATVRLRRMAVDPSLRGDLEGAVAVLSDLFVLGRGTEGEELD
jgi:glutamyl-tRNA reductase